MGRKGKRVGRRGVVLAALLLAPSFTACSESWSNATGGTLEENPGPEHCEMQSATFLRYNGENYARDPENLFSVDDGQIEATYKEDTALHGNATFTGYKKGDAELWTAPGVEAVFVKTRDVVEQWPLATEVVCG